MVEISRFSCLSKSETNRTDGLTSGKVIRIWSFLIFPYGRHRFDLRHEPTLGAYRLNGGASMKRSISFSAPGCCSSTILRNPLPPERQIYAWAPASRSTAASAIASINAVGGEPSPTTGWIIIVIASRFAKRRKIFNTSAYLRLPALALSHRH